MEDNFDKEFKKHGDSYKVQPREWVWPRVEAELEKEKDRRIVAWWWMLPLAFLMLGGGYLLIGNRKTGSNTTTSSTIPTSGSVEVKTSAQPNEKNLETSTTQSTDKTINALKTDTKKIAASALKTTDANKKNNTIIEKKTTSTTIGSTNKKATLADKKTSSSNNPVISSTDISHLKSIDKPEKNIAKQPPVDNEKATIKENILSSDKTVELKHESSTASIEKPTGNIIATTNTTDDSTFVKIDENIVAKKQIDSTKVKKELLKEDSTVTIAIQKKAFKKEVMWTINAGLGTANNKNGSGLSKLFNTQPLSYADYIQNGPITGGTNGGCTACNVITGPIISNKARINLSLSIERSQWISKRWQWQAEMGWQFQQIQQRTGGRKDSVISSSSFNNLIYSYYYQGGSNVRHKGYNHRLFISNQLAFSLLKNRKLLLSAGIYGGINIGNNYLVSDKTNWRFVDGKKLYKNVFAGGEIGLSYTLKNNWFIGLSGKADFTRSFTPPDGNNQYWKSWQLQAGMPLSNIKHLFKK